MKRIFVITGPTATGKTDLGLEVAQEINGSVISADSRQVYAGMNIGTAKPIFAWSEITHTILVADSAGPVTAGPSRPSLSSASPARGGAPRNSVRSEPPRRATRTVPHYLFNVRQPSEPLSLSDWQAMAFTVIDQIHEMGLPAVLAGGTMLYIDSIIKNYDLPQVPPNPALRTELAAKEADQLYAELLQKDPAARAFIQPLNKRRIIRALEVIAATGQAFSRQRRQLPPRYDVTAIGLFDSWEALGQRITQRITTMFDDGLVEETRRLIDTYGAELPLLQTMNYQQVLSVLNGELTEKEAQEEMRRANLKYARRQMSWWRGRSDVAWHSPHDHEAIKKRLLSF